MGGGREKLEGSKIDWKGEDGRFRKRLEGRSWKVLKGNGIGEVGRFRKGMELEKLEDLEREWKGEVGRFTKEMEARTWKV